jgi:hypothetical protein
MEAESSSTMLLGTHEIALRHVPLDKNNQLSSTLRAYQGLRQESVFRFQSLPDWWFRGFPQSAYTAQQV